MIPDTLPALLAQRLNNAAPALFAIAVRFRIVSSPMRAPALQGLRKLGVGGGDCVTLWLPNLPAWLSAFFACAQLGAIAVSVNTRFRSHEPADISALARAVRCCSGRIQGIDFAGSPPATRRRWRRWST